MGKKVMLIDTKGCNGCYSCQIGCKDEHVANDWTPVAKPMPEIGHFWFKLNQKVRGQVPKVKVAYRPQMCMHCDNPPCFDACKHGAKYKREDGLVIIDPVKCVGCRNCVDLCPYGSIYFNEDLNISQKCTGCAHLVDGGWKETRCTDNCPTVCMRFVDEDSAEAKAFIKDAEVLKPELNTKPRVYYKGLPKKFIAGTAFDPVADEVYVDGDVTLTGAGKTYQTKTDHFGDFWFEDLPDGVYKLEIKAGGKSKVLEGIDITKEDINVGDIPL
ncbi:MAG: 4Fe-4S dicluster domain-containing protein [Oscillospiraceae bacterium]|nr:4Fe-4S dicluster domain-containing protein [Oscillospiraceae bacterium]